MDILKPHFDNLQDKDRQAKQGSWRRRRARKNLVKFMRQNPVGVITPEAERLGMAGSTKRTSGKLLILERKKENF